MSKKTSINNDFLSLHREKTSPKIYTILVELVNEGRQDIAELVIKVDYLLDYGTTCVKHKDFSEAREILQSCKSRIDKLKKENVDVTHLQYLYEGLEKKIK